jgi:hypothetical protein
MADVLTIESLASSLSSGGAALKNVPALLRQVLESGVWKDFTTTRGERVAHDTWESFVTTLPLKGLGATADMIRNLCAGEPRVLDLLDQAMQRAPSLHAVDIINSSDRPAGTSQAQALRRLRKDAPELHAEVLAGHLSPHAAMVKAGFRRRTVSVPMGDPERTAAAILRHMPPESIPGLLEAIRRGSPPAP